MSTLLLMSWQWVAREGWSGTRDKVRDSIPSLSLSRRHRLPLQLTPAPVGPGANRSPLRRLRTPLI